MLQTKCDGSVGEIINDYRKKAEFLKKRSFRLAYIALLFLVVIVTAFFLADQITNTGKANELKKTESILESHANALLSAWAGSTIYDSTGRIVKKFIVKDGDTLPVNTDSGYVAAIYKDMNNVLDKYERTLNQSNQLNIDFFTTLSTKIGTILIMIFVVQILLRWYRYDIRLANYFEARANALELHFVDNSLSFDKIINLISPDIYDVGSAKSPSESIISFLNNNRTNGR